MKKIVVIGVLVVLIAGLVFTLGGLPPSSVPEENLIQEEGARMEDKPATGNIDDAATAILKDAEGDQEPTVEDSAVFDNSQALDSFGQTFDGSQF